MKQDTARWLTSDEGREVLAWGLEPASLADAERLRRFLEPERAAAVLAQVALRRKAVVKFGARAEGLFFTSDGLEQATRPAVAAWRARRFVDAGATSIVDLGCGIGADAMAMLDAGMSVRAVELDPVTAIFAEANLGIPVEVMDATTVAIADDEAVFCDPARRTDRGRTWRVEDFTPPWDFATGLLAGRVACLKLGPGVPYALLPPSAATTWVSHRGDVVEASIWSVGEPGSRSALLLPSGFAVSSGTASAVPVAMPKPGDIVLEPDGAIIRAGLVDRIAGSIGASRVHKDIAYLVADVVPEQLVTAGAVAAFRVDDVLPYSEKELRAWVRKAGIGVLEIKKRGIEVDPAALRRRLRPRGDMSATLVVTPTSDRAVVLVVEPIGRAR